MRSTLVRRLADPWAKREAWRYEGHFTKANMYRNLWPGFTYGVGAFVLYCIGEKALGGKSHSEHGAEHSEH
ncbi:hypothetical protein BN1211_0967 [Cyberlindnera jadinii]|uniref:Uncharacterized protein n=1 Tax=Cyberlindnera jadinii (strain ATCC 18201 / CBS 1600 / BCRC 20928 / JCM 3617 / NBRC 0987 / NRRL Y-1542) TaxID=983966 RepID=A0A0H5BZM4_CYBJN|nr:hypothetical protein CYBJADRAFT_182504 [Cyberlindnera jadinii NRRL Y-1542]ODV76328.1 hypothetical protein CYBJADRAFT_182504 [Cyberlindnera jadinii NRRL Y-1542]CEP20980.1 hypothetical protein BN1211_0967 [Cyberlindnera jadinii]